MTPAGRFCVCSLLAALLGAFTACGGGSSSSTPPPVVLTLGASSVAVPQDGSAANVSVSASGGSGTIVIAVSGLPSGITGNYSSGTLTLIGSASAAAGTYTAKVTATAGSQTASQNLTVTSAIVATVEASVDTTQGSDGILSQFMSTSFQPAEWDNGFFASDAPALETALTQLGPQHIRIQGISQGVPMKSNTGTTADWDFTVLDSIVQPVLASADHSPEFQVAVAPAWMLNANGQFDIQHHLADFAAYSANLVRYYNTGGFNWAGQHFQSPSTHPIHWWGVFNEFNGNGLTAAQYVQLYNAVVPAMLAVDPTIQFSALEFSDYGLGSGDAGDPMQFLPTFFASAAAGGVKGPVGILSTHFYSTCNQQDADSTLFATIPQFVANVQYFQQQAKTRPDLGSMPVWVTENNVNADYSNANGQSTCNPSQKFVTDLRGTSAFFAAWRPYVFAELGKAGNQALYHWDYDADQQYGEVDYNTGNTYLSYWVDQTLAALYPVTAPGEGPSILKVQTTESSDVEVLATRGANNTVVVLVADRAVNSSTDNNGAGSPRTIIVDVSSLSGYTSAQQITLDAGTNIATGPAPIPLTLSPRMTVSLKGYGSSYLILKQ